MDRPVLGGGAAAFLGAAFFLAGAFLAGAFFLAWHLLGAVRNATIPFLVVKLQFVIFFYTLYIYLFQFIFDEKMYQLFWYGVAACFTATAYPHPGTGLCLTRADRRFQDPRSRPTTVRQENGGVQC